MFTLKSHFSNGMVFQRNKPLVVEGLSRDEGVMSLTLSDGSKKLSEERFDIPSGPFLLRLSPRPVSRGLTLTVSDGEQTETFTDVYVGEVWVAGGQSNMEWWLMNCDENERRTIKSNGDIRFFTVGRNVFPDESDYRTGYAFAHCKDYGWAPCGERSAPFFSAVAYHFAHKLYEALNMPIGVINCNVGGSSIFSWLPEEAFINNPDIRFKWDELRETVERLGLKNINDRYYAFLEENRPRGDAPPNVAGTWQERNYIYYDEPGPYNYQRPAALYRSMLEKVINFSARGMIWYQGETETYERGVAVYGAALSALIGNLKKHQPEQYNDYAFNFVQLAPWNDPDAGYWAAMCDAMRRFAVENPKYGMVTVGDLGGGTDIHPPRKQGVGERLARAAMHLNYNMPSEYSGPVAVRAERDGGYVRIDFTHAAGLCKHRVLELGKFELVTADGAAREVTAVIKNGSVYADASGADNPVYVQYEYVPEPKIGLYNAAGIPASVFRLEIE